jgi:hypothetical protein
MPCREDVDCRGIFPAGTLTELLCLPGDPDPGAGVVGYCLMNQSLDVFLGEATGRQGTFCEQADDTCAVDHECVNPEGNRTAVGPVVGKWFCGRACESAADCPAAPVPHDCPGNLGQRFCVPQAGAPHAREFWAECYDHRQCTDGICFQPDPGAADVGHCTRTCSAVRPCTGYGSGGGDPVSTCLGGVCQPAGAVEPNG